MNQFSQGRSASGRPPSRDNGPTVGQIERGVTYFLVLFIRLVFSAIGDRADSNRAPRRPMFDLESLAQEFHEGASIDDPFQFVDVEFPAEHAPSTPGSSRGIFMTPKSSPSPAFLSTASSPSKDKGKAVKHADATFTNDLQPGYSVICPPPPAGIRPRNKFYVVSKGLRTGIFDTWTETGYYVTGVRDAVYQSYDVYQAALADFQSAMAKGNVTTLPDEHGTLLRLRMEGKI